jgi:hypothetical protein
VNQVRCHVADLPPVNFSLSIVSLSPDCSEAWA